MRCSQCQRRLIERSRRRVSPVVFPRAGKAALAGNAEQPRNTAAAWLKKPQETLGPGTRLDRSRAHLRSSRAAIATPPFQIDRSCRCSGGGCARRSPSGTIVDDFVGAAHVRPADLPMAQCGRRRPGRQFVARKSTTGKKVPGAQIERSAFGCWSETARQPQRNCMDSRCCGTLSRPAVRVSLRTKAATSGCASALGADIFVSNEHGRHLEGGPGSGVIPCDGDPGLG